MYFVINESEGIFKLNASYMVIASDPSGNLASVSNALYLTVSDVVIDILMNVSRVYFTVLDNITGEPARGA